MSFSKKLTSVFLSLCMVVSVLSVAIVPAAAETAYETYAQKTVRGSNILHCFNWSYNQIKSNLADIAKAGYTAVQTSPVQSPKDYNSSWTDLGGQWWKMYQPLGFSVSNSSWLGTKAQLTSLCTEAEKYNIKVVVDIVANHLANNGTDGGTYSYINSGVESDLKNANYYHTNNTRVNDDSRYNITQYHLGMPDLNTGNTYVQQRALGLLEECIDCGVDGFRFDAAKHIELPNDPSNCRSNFWPTVINGATDYAEQNGKEVPFYYGEILGGAGTDISNYTTYMAVTDNYTSDLALDKAYYNAASELASSTYHKGASASDSVLWAESHDTYMGNSGSVIGNGLQNTSGVDSTVINRAWAIVGARADSTALFFARPNSTMGYASTDGNWKSKAVSEVNKFKNHFAGTNEYLASSGDNVAYIERGTKGVVISKLDGGGQVSLTAHQMEDGTYTDYVTGGTFTVSNGVISGNVDSQGVAVVYNADESAGDFIEADTLYLDPGISSWKQGDERYAMYVFDSNSSYEWVSMTDSNSDGIYEADVPTGNWTGVIFCTMNASDQTNSWDNKINQTVDLYPSDGNDLFTITGADQGDSSKFNGTWSVYSPQEETTEPTTQPTTEPVTQPSTEPSSDTYTVYAVDNANWNSNTMNVHYWGDAETSWPGTAMTQYSGNKVFKFDVPKNVSGIIFNVDNGSKQTVNIESGITDGAVFVISTEKSGNNYKVSLAPTYYLVGSMNGWSNNDDYAFSITNTDAGAYEYKLSGVQLSANTQIKVHSSSDTWYPGGSDNNYTVSADGTYDIYFRPNGDGNTDWHGGYFYAVNVTQYTVTWKDGDGNTLKTDTVRYGDTPEYDGETPTKTADSQYTYAFNNTWSPAIAPVTADVTYEAQFDANINTYTVTWVNYDDSVLETDSAVEYGTMPVYNGETPTKAATAQYTYTFVGWLPTVSPVTSAITYKAVYESTVNKYTVTFLNDDETVLASADYEYGSTPVYLGIPTKSADAGYHYTFSGWDNQIVPVTKNAVYKAQYTEIDHIWDEDNYQAVWSPAEGSDIDDPESFTPSCKFTVVCKDCGYEDTVNVHVTLGSYVPATCSQKGTAVYNASFENISTTGTFHTPTTSHTYGEPVWDWASDYTSVTVTFTCTECNYQSVQYPPIETIETVLPSCTEDGHINYKSLISFNGKNYTDTATKILPAFGSHDLRHHSATTPTASANGTTEYWQCDRCGKYFSDANAQTEINEKDTLVPYFTYTKDGNDVLVSSYYGADTAIVIPDTVPDYYPDETLRGETITKIPYGVFTDNTRITSVSMGDYITEIGWKAFENCLALKEVHIGSGIQLISANSFFNCNLDSFYCTKNDNTSKNDTLFTYHTFNSDECITFYGPHTGKFYEEAHMDFINYRGVSNFKYIGTDAHTDTVTFNWDGYTCTEATAGCSKCDYKETISGVTVSSVVTTEPTYEADGLRTYTASVMYNCNEYTDTKTEVIPYEDIITDLAGHSISLDGSIGVNFYMELSDDVIANKDTAYMHFTIPKNGEPGTKDVYVKDADTRTVGDKTYYIFTCDVAAKEIESNITAQLFNGDQQSRIYTYSVKQYADYLIAHQNESATFKKAVPLVEAMLTYGENARYYFDKIDEKPADLDVTIPEFTRTVYDLPEGVTYGGVTLSLKSETTLSIYFNSETKPTLTCNDPDVTYETEKTGTNEYVIRIRGIAAYDLDKQFTVYVNGQKAVDYSPMTYCYKAQNSSDTKLANTVKALYLYWQAAQNYFGDPENGGGN